MMVFLKLNNTTEMFLKQQIRKLESFLKDHVTHWRLWWSWKYSFDHSNILHFKTK